jgi:hypothetical protein
MDRQLVVHWPLFFLILGAAAALFFLAWKLNTGKPRSKRRRRKR